MFKSLLVITLLFYSFSTKVTLLVKYRSEGAAGIENPKTRSLSYTLQYSTS